MKLSYKFSIAIAAVTMASLIVLGLIFSMYTTNVIKIRIYDQLKSISTLKENQLNNYVDQSKNDMEALALDTMVVEYMSKFHGEPENESLEENISAKEEDLAEKMLLERLSQLLNYSEFNKLSIITMEGVVDVSTDPDEKGKIKSQESYFINGLNSAYVQNFYISISAREPTMTISTPIRNNKGDVLSVLAGDIHLNQISDIMVERSGLGNTGETLIINKNHLLVSESRFMKDIAFKKTIYSKGVNECLSGDDGAKEYKDYRDVNVISYLKWMPEKGVCLITKIDRNEVYSSLTNLYLVLIFFGVLVLMTSFLLAYFLSKLFTKPIIELVDGTEHWARGDFSHAVLVNSNDEIAKLCIAFNDASKEMLKSKMLEKNYTIDLKKELEEKTHEMKISLEELERSKKALLNIMDDLSDINKHLLDLDKAKTDFLNVASHELKTPLTAISAYLEILDDYKGQFNKEQLQGLDAIKRNSNQLKMLIGNILEVSRLDSGRFDLNITEINVKEKIMLLVDNLKILSDNKHIKLAYDCDGIEKIYTDAMRFEEILNNLIGNAIKFTDKGSITVKTEFGRGKEKGFVVISVIDTGVGIAEDKMNNLFQKFYQVDATVSRKYGGTGLGLSITKKMIELQGGKISVSSAVGKGTTFRFTLPIQPLKKPSSNNGPKADYKADDLYTNVGAITLDKDVAGNVEDKNAASAGLVSSKNLKDKKRDSKNMKGSKNAAKRSKSDIKIHSNSKQINRHTPKKNK